MSTLPRRWLFNATIVLSFFLPLVSSSQITIREKAEIKPNPGFRPGKVAAAQFLKVVSSFSGLVADTMPALVYVNGPCNIKTGVPGASGTLNVPAFEGIYQAGYRFTTPTGGQFNFSVLLGDSVLVEIHESFDANITASSQHDIELYSGIAFSAQYAAIWTKTENYFGAAIVTGTEPCSEAHWSPRMTVEVEITQGADIGEFIDVGGIPVGSKITKRLSDLNNLMFLADGPRGYGDVEITARSGDIVIAQTFPVKVHPPTVRIDPPYESYWPIVVDFAHLQLLKFYEYHYPQPGEQYEPAISWFPADTINTKNYIDTFDDTLHLFVKVMAENPGGVAVDSSEVILVKACIKVTFDRPTLLPGDTAGLSFQRVLPDGSFEDLAEGDYLFSATILGGEDSSKGLLVGEDSAATSLIDERSIQYVAPKTIQGSKLEVQVSGAAIASGGGEASIGLPLKPSPLAARVNATLAKKGIRQTAVLSNVAVKNKPGPARLTDAMKEAAALSSWCPINKVVIQKPTLKILDHAPWAIWPYLPSAINKKGEIESRGADRPGYNPKRSFNIQVRDPSDQPVKNAKVKVITGFEEQSGGHKHDLGITGMGQEKQGFFYGQGTNRVNGIVLTTDESGMARVDSLVASQASGKYLVTACLVADTTVKDTVNLEVKVPGLVNLVDYQDESFTFAQTPSGRANHPDNTWCTKIAVDSLSAGIWEFYEWTKSQKGRGKGIRTSINDLSLPWGGLFDIDARWKIDTASHCFHRVGLSVDINRSLSVNQISQLTTCMDHYGGKRYEEDNIHYGFNGGK